MKKGRPESLPFIFLAERLRLYWLVRGLPLIGVEVQHLALAVALYSHADEHLGVGGGLHIESGLLPRTHATEEVAYVGGHHVVVLDRNLDLGLVLELVRQFRNDILAVTGAVRVKRDERGVALKLAVLHHGQAGSVATNQARD